MIHSKADIENLNKIIIELADDRLSTVPEILYGDWHLPASNSQEALACRTYEDILINNGICSVQANWTPNDTPGGYKPIFLASGGRAVLRSGKSVEDFLEQKEQDSRRLGGLTWTVNTVIGSPNSNIAQGRDEVVVNTGSYTRVNGDNAEVLAQKLRDRQVDQSDIDELLIILKSDTPNKEKGVFGAKTNGWISKMLSKSIDGTWQIGLGAAGGLLEEVIKKFYGL